MWYTHARSQLVHARRSGGRKSPVTRTLLDAVAGLASLSRDEPRGGPIDPPPRRPPPRARRPRRGAPGAAARKWPRRSWSSPCSTPRPSPGSKAASSTPSSPVPGLAQGFPDVRCDAAGLCLMTTAMGFANAASLGLGAGAERRLRPQPDLFPDRRHRRGRSQRRHPRRRLLGTLRGRRRPPPRDRPAPNPARLVERPPRPRRPRPRARSRPGAPAPRSTRSTPHSPRGRWRRASTLPSPRATPPPAPTATATPASPPAPRPRWRSATPSRSIPTGTAA